MHETELTQRRKGAKTQRMEFGVVLLCSSALQYMRILARCEDLPERGSVCKHNWGKANRTEIGSGMNGKGMEHGSPAFIPLPSIPLPSPLAVLDCGVSRAKCLCLCVKMEVL
jgi:hypothetical protein